MPRNSPVGVDFTVYEAHARQASCPALQARHRSEECPEQVQKAAVRGRMERTVLMDAAHSLRLP